MMCALIIVVLPAVRVVSAKGTAGYSLATLQGMVTGFDQDGYAMPLSWVQVNATSQSFNQTVFTGLGGLYVLTLPPGTYEITATISGYQSQSANVTLASQQFMLHNFILRSAYAVTPSPPRPRAEHQ